LVFFFPRPEPPSFPHLQAAVFLSTISAFFDDLSRLCPILQEVFPPNFLPQTALSPSFSSFPPLLFSLLPFSPTPLLFFFNRWPPVSWLDTFVMYASPLHSSFFFSFLHCAAHYFFFFFRGCIRIWTPCSFWFLPMGSWFLLPRSGFRPAFFSNFFSAPLFRGWILPFCLVLPPAFQTP